jgi:hypothetical protein
MLFFPQNGQEISNKKKEIVVSINELFFLITTCIFFKFLARLTPLKFVLHVTSADAGGVSCPIFVLVLK